MPEQRCCVRRGVRPSAFRRARSAGIRWTLVRRDRRVRVGALAAPVCFSGRHADGRRRRHGSRDGIRAAISRASPSRARSADSCPSRAAITRGAGFRNAARAVDCARAGRAPLSRRRPARARSSNGASAAIRNRHVDVRWRRSRGRRRTTREERRVWSAHRAAAVPAIMAMRRRRPRWSSRHQRSGRSRGVRAIGEAIRA